MTTEKQIKLRIEPDLHSWLKDEADRNRRSMSAEIVLLIEAARDRQQQADGGRRHD